MKKIIKISLIQTEPKLGDVEHNLNQAIKMIDAAKKQGADIVCLSELFATGYDMKPETIKVAKCNEKSIFTALAERAAALQIYIIVPLATQHGNNLYNSAILINSSGETQGKYHKINLWGDESDHFQEGDCYPVFDLGCTKIGIMMCSDMMYPEVARKLAYKGAEVIFVPSAWRKKEEYLWDSAIIQRAVENGVFIVGVNQVYCGIEPYKSLFGKSKVCNPFGKNIVELSKDKPAISTATINLQQVEDARRLYPYFCGYLLRYSPLSSACQIKNQKPLPRRCSNVLTACSKITAKL